jgi:hypothetical protein
MEVTQLQWCQHFKAPFALIQAKPDETCSGASPINRVDSVEQALVIGSYTTLGCHWESQADTSFASKPQSR